MKWYSVTYDTKEGKAVDPHIKLIYASNAQHAREMFDKWHTKNSEKHAFHIKIRLAPKCI